MCLQSCHKAVITDWAVLVLMLSFSLIKVDMKPQPVQIAEPLCPSFCFICNFKTCHRCAWDQSCSSFHCKIKEWALWAMWGATLFIPKGAFLWIWLVGTLFFLINWFINTLHHSHPCFNQHMLWSSYSVSFSFNQSIGVKPDKSPGDPAARVLALH